MEISATTEAVKKLEKGLGAPASTADKLGGSAPLAVLTKDRRTPVTVPLAVASGTTTQVTEPLAVASGS